MCAGDYLNYGGAVAIYDGQTQIGLRTFQEGFLDCNSFGNFGGYPHMTQAIIDDATARCANEQPVYQCQIEDGIQDYQIDNSGISSGISDGDIPQENAETTAEKTFCNGSGQQVKIVQGLNGGTVIRNDTTGVHYYRDPQTGKLSFFDNTELTRYLPAS